MKNIIMLILSASLAICRANAQAPDTTARHFIIMASIGNLQEAGSGKLAAQKATKADVRSFGQMMVMDHSDAEQKLLQLVKTKGVTRSLQKRRIRHRLTLTFLKLPATTLTGCIFMPWSRATGAR